MNRRLMMLTAVALLTAVASAPLAQTRPAQQTPTFRSGIDLVQVDVVVVDEDGKAVRGLTAADFALLDRGKRQPVAAFEEVSHDRPAAAEVPVLPVSVRLDVANNQTAQANRLVVMVVDDLHIYKERTAKAKEIAQNVLERLASQSSMAVLFTSGDHSTQVTEDRALLAAAVGTLKGRQSWRRPHQAIDQQTGARIDPEDSIDVAMAKVQQSQDTKVQDFFDNMTQYKTLQDAARMLGGNDLRRKAFVLLSEGIGKDLSGIFGAMAPPGDIPSSSNEVQPIGYHAYALVEMMESLRRSNVATYAIDPRGLVRSEDLAHECFPQPRPGDDPCSNGLTDWHSVVRQAQHGLEIMSEASGGFAVTNTNDFTGGLDRIVEDLDHYYLLGFYPKDPKGNKYRRLDVQIPGHPDWRLHFRRGYMPGGPPMPPKNADPLVALAAGILPTTDLPLRLTAIPLAPLRAASAAVAKTTRVALAVEVSAHVHDLQDADGRLRDTLRYEVLVVNEAKKKVTSLSGLEGRLTLSPSTGGETMPETVAYQVARDVDLAPGRYQLRVSATSVKLGTGGSVYLYVDVPDFSSAPLALGGLVLGYAGGARVPVAPPAPVAGAPAMSLPFAPSLDREFTPADTLRVYFDVVSRAPRRSPRATIEIRGTTGHVHRTIAPDLDPADRFVDLELPLDDLAAGAYLLRATVTDESRKATREIGFLVR